MLTKTTEKGFTLIEVIIAILIMTTGVLALLSAISYAVLREKEAEQRNVARQLTTAALESIFARRDLLEVDTFAQAGIFGWNTVANTTTATPQGVFLTGYRPIRQDSGSDGLEGTADDACAAGANCVVGSYTNSSPVFNGYEREIIFTDIYEPNSTIANRRRIVVNVRYITGQLQRVETVTTIIGKRNDQ